MPAPAYTSNREPLGAFAVSFTLTPETDWTEINVRSAAFLTRADVTAQLAMDPGVDSTSAADTAMLRSYEFQNVGASTDPDYLISSRIDGGAPDPTDAYLTCMAGGGVAGETFHSRLAQTSVWYKIGGAGTNNVNVTIRFDVPRTLPGA